MEQENVIGPRIKIFREAAGMTQSAFASALEGRGLSIPATTVYKIEQGKRNVLASELPPIADALGVDVKEILGLASDRAPLVSAGARRNEAQRHLLDAAVAYARAMLSYAQAADGAPLLHEVDERYAREHLARQTPGWVAALSVEAIEATLKLNRVDVMEGHALAVLDALRADFAHFHGDHDG